MHNPLIKHIPLRPHVRQFMLRTYGPEPVHIHQNSDLGRLIRLCVHKNPFRQDAAKAAVPRGGLVIQLPTALRHQTISDEKLRWLGEYCEKLFQANFIHYMIGCTLSGESDWGGVRRFHESYGLDCEDYDMDALRKVWRDYKAKTHRSWIAAEAA